MKSILTLLFFTSCLTVKTQSFEGIVKYLVEFEIKSHNQEIKEKVVEKLKSEGSYFDTLKIYFKEGKYKKVNNAIKAKSTIYLPEENKLYFLEKGFEYVTVLDADNPSTIKSSYPEPEIQILDSIKEVNGIRCNLLKLKIDKLGEEYYAYNHKHIPINPELFIKHKYENLNLILNSTKSYPLEFTTGINGFVKIRMSFISIEKTMLSDELFEIPGLVKAEKKVSKLMNQITNGQLMKIKN